MPTSGQDETQAGRDEAANQGDGAGGGDPRPDPTAELQSRVQELEARLRTVSAAFREKQEEIHAVRDRLQRQAAVQEEIRRGEVVASLFEPVENLHRSIESVKGHSVEVGLRMVYQQFLDALKALGLEEVPGVGSKFDPNVHEAIATAPVGEAARDNTIVSVFSTGYRIGSRLVRPARVVIGSFTAPVAEA